MDSLSPQILRIGREGIIDDVKMYVIICDDVIRRHLYKNSRSLRPMYIPHKQFAFSGRIQALVWRLADEVRNLESPELFGRVTSPAIINWFNLIPNLSDS